ncbi:MAG: TRAP transporter small permease, partial [Sedimenticola sp.]|nr:TRAP transporter small permease [Sedimenticola sp.]
MTQLKRLGTLLLQVEDLLLSLLLTSMILLATSQILLRNFWDYSLTWGDPSLRLMVLWITLLGA